MVVIFKDQGDEKIRLNIGACPINPLSAVREKQ